MKTVKQMMRCCYSKQESDAFFKKKNIEIIKENYSRDKKHLSQFKLGLKGKTFYLFIAGTNQKQDWKYNFNIRNYELNDNAKCHLGFHSFSEMLINELLLDERFKISKDYSIKVYGHSLGSAVAQIFSYEYQNYFKKIETLICDSPKVFKLGSKVDFKKNVKITSYNYFLDIVRHLPFLRYKHVIKSKSRGRGWHAKWFEK